MSKIKKDTLYKDALDFHAKDPKGKIAIELPKPLTNQLDLSLAYSPGVGAPCLEIEKNPDLAYEYTAKGNFVAVISNGTAVLGLGDLGAIASKPVMEGKAALFKRFADINAIDLEIDSKDTDEIVQAVRLLAPSFGGINLEDIKAPDCFVIESKLKELVDIPVFHDDQHGTAIITTAALINACEIAGKTMGEIKMVVSGAGAAAIACIELIKKLGVPHQNVILCDSKGVVYIGREHGMNPWKERHAVDTKHRTIADAMAGADVFLGVSVKDAVSKDMVKSMSDKPIVFACANPDPEIVPEDVLSVKPDAIVATGRSDYPNQVNNIMGFPYIFRGALDVQAKVINDEMKIAAANALAQLAKEPVPASVTKAYDGENLKFGPDYIIPVPFDPRLIHTIPHAVAKAAIDTGVARKQINLESYKQELDMRLNASSTFINLLFTKLQNQPKRVLFADGDEEVVVKAAIEWYQQGYGTPILLGYEEKISAIFENVGYDGKGIEILNAGRCEKLDEYINLLYKRLQRKGYSVRDCARLIKRDRNVFSAHLLLDGIADGMVTGYNRSYLNCIEDISLTMDKKNDDGIIFGLSAVRHHNNTFFITDTLVHELPDSELLAKIAINAAYEVEALGYEPRVAFVSFSNFGSPTRKSGLRIQRAVEILDAQGVNFEYEGELSPEVALSGSKLQEYEFCRLTKPANVLIMPGLHSASISSKLIQELAGGRVIGPILCGLEKSVQIVPIGAEESDILNLAALSVCKDV